MSIPLYLVTTAFTLTMSAGCFILAQHLYKYVFFIVGLFFALATVGMGLIVMLLAGRQPY